MKHHENNCKEERQPPFVCIIPFPRLTMLRGKRGNLPAGRAPLTKKRQEVSPVDVVFWATSCLGFTHTVAQTGTYRRWIGKEKNPGTTESRQGVAVACAMDKQAASAAERPHSCCGAPQISAGTLVHSYSCCSLMPAASVPSPTLLTAVSSGCCARWHTLDCLPRG